MNHSFKVFLGIFLSRVFGLIRERVFAHFLGVSAAGDAFRVAIRIPNLIQNLLGEGVLSSSFVPSYIERYGKNPLESQKLARTVFSFLCCVGGLLSLLGIYFTRPLIFLIAPGLAPQTQDLVSQLMEYIFPGLFFLVLSAWCLGILNSHKKFFLPYVAPVGWNLCLIGSLFLADANVADFQNLDEKLRYYAIMASKGFFVGGFVQFFIQLPSALQLIQTFHPWDFDFKSSHFLSVLKNFLPSLMSRGVVQISAYAETVFASFLAVGVLSQISFSQTLAILPLSLFAMSISVVQLTELSGLDLTISADKIKNNLVSQSLTMSSFLWPSVIALLFFGKDLSDLFFLGGRFTEQDSAAVGVLLSLYATSLLASGHSRLLSSVHFAMKETRKPFVASVLRVSVFIFIMLIFLYWPMLKEGAVLYGGALIVGASSFGAWSEYFLLKRLLPAGLRSCPLLWSKKQIHLLLLSLLSAGLTQGLCLLFLWASPVLKILTFCVLVAGLNMAFLTAGLGLMGRRLFQKRP